MITRTFQLLMCAAFALNAWGQASLGSGAPSPTGAGDQAVRAIRQLLDAQVQAWNKGDLEGFMAGYWNSPELTFFSNDSETHGWQQTLERYKKRYQGEGHTMGTLDFQQLRITPMSNRVAIARGKFHLKMPDGKEMSGMFTLVLERFKLDEWKIVHDHSSS